jgi:hypothetical protein
LIFFDDVSIPDDANTILFVTLFTIQFL